MDLADEEHRDEYPDWSNRTRDAKNKRVIIHHEGEAVGFYTPYKSGKHWRTGTIYIAPEHRGKGIGTKVITDFFSKKKYGKAYIEPTNLRSMGAFKNAGFKESHNKVVWHDEDKPTEYTIMKKEPNKYLDQIEKQSSLLLGAVATHMAQNLATKAAMGNKSIGKYFANSFAEGAKGVVNTSLKSRAARLLTGATVPDLALAHKKFHEMGGAMRPMLNSATKRQKVGLRMLSEGRVKDLQKYNLHKDPVIQHAHALANKALNLPTISKGLDSKTGAVEKIFSDKSHPLASNILKNVSRGKNPIGAQYKPGSMSSKISMAGSVASSIAEPAAGALNSVKTLVGSKSFGNTRIGAKINSMIEKQFIKKPVTSGIALSNNNGTISKLKHRASELIVNPVSAQLKRTSAALTDALKT